MTGFAAASDSNNPVDDASDQTNAIEIITIFPSITQLSVNSSVPSRNTTTEDGKVLSLTIDPHGTNITITLDGNSTLILDGASMGFNSSAMGIAVRWQAPEVAVTDGEKGFFRAFFFFFSFPVFIYLFFLPGEGDGE